MTDNGGFTCERLREIGAELALGVLPAEERAGAMEHLEHCPACREHLHELAATSDALLDLVPGSEPPVGFEDRVIDRLGLAFGRPPHRRVQWRRFALAAAAAAAGLALGGGGWVLGASVGRPAPVAPIVSPVQPQLLTAELANAGESFGQVYLYTGTSPWLYMAVDADGHSGTVRCQLQRADGSTVRVGSFTLNHKGYGSWAGPYPAGTSPVTGVRLLNPDGSVLASATFGRLPG
ncbi:anti-sigma factor family protein [Streptomyces sp. NPDC056230]|uniref:anti-sigma factor family protein n=1 Tax=Streptomyces sp. NPDC056230 TaxID=3345754 RepID=UPI0035DA28BC